MVDMFTWTGPWPVLKNVKLFTQGTQAMKIISTTYLTRIYYFCLLALLAGLFVCCTAKPTQHRKIDLFVKNWHFFLGEVTNGEDPALDDFQWRVLDLPHDWSIEGQFSQDNPATPGGGALPGGIGWYRKSFTLPENEKNWIIFIEFDGVYRNSEVWINGHYLGKRPYGYISFGYDLTPFLKYGPDKNVLAVRVDNSQQPNSRWYSGSGIYRNVRLVKTEKIYVDHWGTFITTREVSEQSARVSIRTRVRNASGQDQPFKLKTTVLRDSGKNISTVNSVESESLALKDSVCEIVQELTVENPILWSLDNPHLYRAVSTIECAGRMCDDYQTTFGIRSFEFNIEKGFLLNGKQIKINGVCNHHDLGCLGAAVNTRSIERQLQILQAMGCNGIRTSHNPPAPELLDLCDRMGFIVMDEAFDMWKLGKNPFDYHLDFEAWHQRDLQDQVLRDRNHPSVFVWSIGNEVLEQWNKQDSSGSVIARELAGIVKKLDPTRPVTAACNDQDPLNPVIKSGALDLIGYNYAQNTYPDFPKTYPGKRFIATETVSALATRGSYDMPSDRIRRWPLRWDLPFTTGNADYTCSSYDNCCAPWGSTHEETLRIMKKYEFLSGMFIWTGFDYLGEPTPYGWPARSSYFGIVDLAGFPKDAYYLYQSEWTQKPVLHIFPYWNWKDGQLVDVWAYTNCEEVELFLNGQSQGTSKKTGDDLHLVWHLSFIPGTLKAIGRNSGKESLIQEIKTAGEPAKIVMEADRSKIIADGRDLSFVTVKILDKEGILVPYADNLIRFAISGAGRIAAVDNGLQTSREPFIADHRRAFHGLALVVIRAAESAGEINLQATSEGLEGSSIRIESK
jgi:beta-galactosidase